MSDYSNRTLMILGAGQLQVPIIKRAKEKGLHVIVVSPAKNDPGVEYADNVVCLDVKDEKNILERAKAFEIDGITTDQTDLPVRTAAYISDAMGLPGIGYELGCLFTNKFLQRKKCNELGILTPRYALVKSSKEAEEFFSECESDIIIKPIDSQASHGVSKITKFSQIESFFEEARSYARNGEVLMEEWIDGTEFSIDCYVENGKVHPLAIGQYHPFSIDGVFSSYQTVFPPKQPERVLSLIRLINEKIVNGFGLKNGRTHAEYIVAKDKCYLVEIAARGGGAYFSSDNVKYVSGFSSEEYLIDLALGIQNYDSYISSERYNVACTLFFYLPEGKVISKDGVDEVCALDFVKRNNLDQIKIGTVTAPIIDKAARYFMIVTAESHDELEHNIDCIRSMLKVVTLTKNGEHFLPIWK